MLEAIGLLSDEKPEEAAECVLDLWRLQALLVRNGVAPDYGEWRAPAVLLLGAVRRLDTPARARLEDELRALDDEWPSFAESARRRLAFGCALRAWRRGDFAMNPEFYGPPSAPVAAVLWTEVNGLFDAEEQASHLSAPRSSPRAGAARSLLPRAG